MRSFVSMNTVGTLMNSISFQRRATKMVAFLGSSLGARPEDARGQITLLSIPEPKAYTQMFNLCTHRLNNTLQRMVRAENYPGRRGIWGEILRSDQGDVCG